MDQLGCAIIRINGFDEIGKIRNYIIESTKKLAEESTKKFLIEIFSERLPNLKFKSDH